MSQENVNVVRGWLRALTAGDLDAMAEFWDPNITWRPIEGIGEMEGREAMRRYAREWVDMFDEITNVPEELLEIGDDCVVAVQRATGRAKASGIETEARYAVVYTLRDGKIVRGREYIDREQALEAVRE